MALVITDSQGRDVRELEGATFDLAYGSDENNWEMTLSTLCDIRLENRARVYLEGTEYGGIYDSRKVNTEKHEITYSGRTWSGVLAGKRLVPDRGSDYISFKCDANTLIAMVISRTSLEGLFRARPEPSNIIVSGRFDRYTDAYSGLCKALSAAGAKLKMLYDGSRVEAWAGPIRKLVDGQALDADEISLKISQNRGVVNHLVCAGQGVLADRIEVHLYADRAHNISRAQSLFGVDEVADFYDYSNASAEDLLEKGIEKLRDLQTKSESVEVTISSAQELDIGDLVGATDPETGYAVTANVSKKIVTLEGSDVQIEYKATTAATVSVER